MRRRQRDGKIGDPMVAGQQSGENRDVCSIGDRAGSECLSKANAVAGQGVERRGLNRIVTVAVDVVGAPRGACG
jgi:hypothetical protein